MHVIGLVLAHPIALVPATVIAEGGAVATGAPWWVELGVPIITGTFLWGTFFIRDWVAERKERRAGPSEETMHQQLVDALRAEVDDLRAQRDSVIRQRDSLAGDYPRRTRNGAPLGPPDDRTDRVRDGRHGDDRDRGLAVEQQGDQR